MRFRDVLADALVLIVAVALILIGFAIAQANASPLHPLEVPHVPTQWPHRPLAYLEEQPPPPVAPLGPFSAVTGPSGGCSSGYALSLVSAYSWDVSVAMAVIDRETGGTFCPWKVNPASQTSGLFQLAPGWWNGSYAFGWVFDPLDPVENVAYAYKIYVYEKGWAPAWCAHIAGLYDPPGC